MYVHDSMSVELRPDLMDEEVSSIWVSLGFKHQKKIIVGGLYREWQQLGRGEISGTAQEQFKRWKLFLEQWKLALSENKETLVLGDINIDWLTCFTTEPSLSSQAYEIKPLVEALTTSILPLGICQIVDKDTRS